MTTNEHIFKLKAKHLSKKIYRSQYSFLILCLDLICLNRRVLSIVLGLEKLFSVQLIEESATSRLGKGARLSRLKEDLNPKLLDQEACALLHE